MISKQLYNALYGVALFCFFNKLSQNYNLLAIDKALNLLMVMVSPAASSTPLQSRYLFLTPYFLQFIYENCKKYCNIP